MTATPGEVGGPGLAMPGLFFMRATKNRGSGTVGGSVRASGRDRRPRDCFEIVRLAVASQVFCGSRRRFPLQVKVIYFGIGQALQWSGLTRDHYPFGAEMR